MFLCPNEGPKDFEKIVAWNIVMTNKKFRSQQSKFIVYFRMYWLVYHILKSS